MKKNIYSNGKKSHKRCWIVLSIIGILILCGINVAIAYVNDYYKANSAAQTAMLQEADDGVTVICGLFDNEKALVFEPETVKAGLIFYPGGKVEYVAYAPLMRELAQNGILCIVPHMPGNLAVFDMYAGEELMQSYPNVEHWYIGGHSLGGSMAAECAYKYSDSFEGLILCAAYSTKDLSTTDLKVLSIYGSEDKVLSMEKYQSNRSNLPEDVIEKVIDGGCHAYFGSYGAQDGDGTPTISNAEQIQTTVDYVKLLMGIYIEE